jgi:hypothetical protein
MLSPHKKVSKTHFTMILTYRSKLRILTTSNFFNMSSVIVLKTASCFIQIGARIAKICDPLTPKDVRKFRRKILCCDVSTKFSVHDVF